jgi:Mrp family chromosome partitioning ATPase
MASVLILGLLVRFATALSREIKAPTLADASEAERLTRAPVLATVRNAMLEGPARFHPSGIDPFRILYLSLTATGTRVRTAIVTGSDPIIAAATGARLAIAAAADHRQTLVVDLDAMHIPLSRTFRERAEPGTSDVLARAFTWREVARPVGSSDGLLITLLPAGTERNDAVVGEAWDTLLESFARLRGAYELTIVVAPPEQLALAKTLVEAAPVILTTVAGETSLAALEREVADIRSANHRLQGLVIWDAPRPELPSRAELAALVSKRKGRTPGGSFEAVQRAIRPNNSGSKGV